MQLLDEKRRFSIMVDYLFGKGVSRAVSKEGVKLSYSRRSGRVKLVFQDGKLFATVKPNGAMALTLHAAKILVKSRQFRENCVTVNSDAAPFVRGGKSVFCKFVTKTGGAVAPGGEVAVLDEQGNVLGVGTALINGKFIKQFKSGVAVKVRDGLAP